MQFKGFTWKRIEFWSASEDWGEEVFKSWKRRREESIYQEKSVFTQPLR